MLALAVFFTQLVCWGISWGCLNPDVIQTSWFMLSKKVVVENTFAIFWMCFGTATISTMIIVGVGIHLWINNLYEVVEKLQQEKK